MRKSCRVVPSEYFNTECEMFLVAGDHLNDYEMLLEEDFKVLGLPAKPIFRIGMLNFKDLGNCDLNNDEDLKKEVMKLEEEKRKLFEDTLERFMEKYDMIVINDQDFRVVEELF